MKTHLRILHLEDDEHDAELIRLLLGREGFTLALDQVANRKKFELALAPSAYDLILSDYTIPGFDGLAALRLALAACPETPFIFVSGSIGEDLAIETLKQGATDYVLKDRLSRLAPSIRRALQSLEDRAERKAAEEVAHASQERTNLLLRSLPFVLYTASGHGLYHLTWLGQNAGAITGYPENHILNEKDFWLSRIHSDDRQKVINDLATLLHRGRATTDYRWQAADGSYRRFIDQQVVVRAEDGPIREVMGSWHDITDLGR